MGIFPSRRKEITAEPSPQNSQCLNPSLVVTPPGANISIAIAVCNFPSGHAEPILRMGEQLKLLSEWLYEGISRAKAEELLLLPYNCEGSFLVRDSQVRKGCYSLSIRHTSHASWDCVKHYRINCLENSWLYISPRLTFSSLQELVDYYSETRDGLCCCLKEPCFIQGSTSHLLHNLSKPVVVSKPALNWQEINSSDFLAEGPVPEDSPISLGLREAVTSYLLITEDRPLGDTLDMKRSRNT
ncbi:src-like-adapter 2 isoform X4 [Sceloporus undulatus]|uniref:src-like-adapter 2 isoform X4 n=1 Tax=Sceloporus undulatus TaxID=8520 RepID=UPI001C4D9C99|nr:src-like-adapter 2 isoform X4 [Sceloporus undulatus]